MYMYTGVWHIIVYIDCNKNSLYVAYNTVIMCIRGNIYI